MPRGAMRKTVDRSKSRNYLTVAQSFDGGAELAKEYEYWNASGVLIIHAAIAYTDAITIRLGGLKSQGENHHETIALAESLLPRDQATKKALNQLRSILDEKTRVSYSGEVYQRKDVEHMWKLLARYRQWALSVLAE